MSEPCPCGSSKPYDQCCAALHRGTPAASAEALMRSRYCAYAKGEIDYLIETTTPTQQADLNRDAITAWSLQSQWLGLDVEEHRELPGNPPHAQVRFTARWRDASGEHAHQELSAFVKRDERWYFLDPTLPVRLGRNDPCLCGSGQKFKKCCGPYLG